MYIKHRRNINKFKAFGLYQTLCLTESFLLRTRLFLIFRIPRCSASEVLEESLKTDGFHPM